MVDPAPSTAQALRRLIYGYQATFLIAAAAELGLADRLAAGRRGVDELAAATGGDPDALRRALVALAQLGLLVRAPDGRFALTPLGDCLRSDHPEGLAAFARYQAHEFIQRPWAALPHTLRTGETAFDAVFGARPFAYLAAHPDAAALFSAGMAARTREHLDAIVAGYAWARFETIVDVGGADGALLAAILPAAPAARGVVFDLPRLRAAAEARIAAAGLAGRWAFVGGDFFTDELPGGDAYLLKHVLHDWDDERAVAILRAVRRAAPAHARLLAIERLLPAGDAPALETAMLDIGMLVVAGGRERTAAEYAALYARAGFRLTRVVDTGSPFSLIEGAPA